MIVAGTFILFGHIKVDDDGTCWSIRVIWTAIIFRLSCSRRKCQGNFIRADITRRRIITI